MFTKGTFGAKEFITFLSRLLLTCKRKVFVIADGHPAHKAVSVRKFLEGVKNRMRIFFLPPYSPELNPDELVWNAFKGNIGRTIVEDQDDLKSKVEIRSMLIGYDEGGLRSAWTGSPDHHHRI